MIAVPFLSVARGNCDCGREGGTYAEPGIACVECGQQHKLMVVEYGVYHCDGPCYRNVFKPRRQPKQVWT